jgi:hypothetical protein
VIRIVVDEREVTRASEVGELNRMRDAAVTPADPLPVFLFGVLPVVE